jgi:hypothetical protein
MDMVSVEEWNGHHHENSKTQQTFSRFLAVYKRTKIQKRKTVKEEQSDPPDEEFQNTLKTNLKIVENMGEHTLRKLVKDSLARQISASPEVITWKCSSFFSDSRRPSARWRWPSQYYF